jgi:lipopolysaccharide transport system ATP-binding protein
MPDIVISVENISKSYELGVIGTGRFRGDLTRWWTRLRGLPDPFAKIGETDHGNREGETIWALKDVSFNVQQGETLGIIGRNGAGKSTLLKILSQVTAPTSGEVKVKGRIASLLEVGTGFHPELTGRENIYLNGAILGMNKEEIRRRFDEIVDFSGVEKFIDTPVKRYSSGMYVRLGFAVAAHLEPEILIVDEVLAVGDAEFQKKCLGKMDDAAHEGRTVIFVSHNMSSISTLCKNTIWIDRGSMKMLAPTEEVISSYLISGVTSDGLKEWSEGYSQPGVDEFKFYDVRVVDAEGRVATQLDVRKPFWIQMTYEIKKPLSHCRVGIRLYTELGVVVFEAFDADDPKYTGARQPGRYLLRCEIPGNFLNARRYILSAYAGIPNFKFLAGAENILALDIENMGPVGSQIANLVRDGVVRPQLRWSQDKVEYVVSH